MRNTTKLTKNEIQQLQFILRHYANNQATKNDMPLLDILANKLGNMYKEV